MTRTRWLLLAVCTLLMIAVCSLLVANRGRSGTFVEADQRAGEDGPGVALDPGRPIGQTFVARHAGLAGVDFFLMPETSGPLSVTLHLRSDPQSDTDLARASLQLPVGADRRFYRFQFSSQDSSHGEYYYAFLDASGPGVSVGLGEGEAYLDGAAYQARDPLDAQTTFRLVYSTRPMIVELFKTFAGWAGLLGVAGLLLVVPGWALLTWFLPRQRLTWAEMLGLAVGASIALFPVLILWTSLAGLNLGALYVWVPVTFGMAALIWRYRSWRLRRGWSSARRWARSESMWPDLTLLVILGLVFGVRLLVVGTLDAPMWADSYHHTMIAQLLADNGGLFESWKPYSEIDGFTYHFGFHSTVAALHWFTRLPMAKATIWTGQLLNGLAILALYPLALRVTGSRWGAVWAVLLAGLLSPMPMFYVNWGRYTQLAGQVILPAAVWLTWEVVDRKERDWRPMALLVLVAGGLALTHYRVLLFYGGFVLALALLSPRRETLLRLACVGGGAVLLCLPWIVNASGGRLARNFGHLVTTPPAQTRSYMQGYNALDNPSRFLAPLWWLVAALGLGLGLWRRQRGVLLAGLWWFLLLVATNPAWLSLPGTGVIQNFTLALAAYIPASLFSAVLVSHLVRRTAGRSWKLPLLTLILASLALWGVRERMGDLDPRNHALVTRPDVRAATWIQEHTPAEARFLVNSTFHYGGFAVVGTDGGWWLPLLAGRENTVPPMVYGSEVQPDSEYRRQIEDLALRASEHGLDNPVVRDLLRENGVTHVYVGQQQGRMWNPEGERIDPGQLAESTGYEVAYHQDRVWVFAIR